jgi:penicillin-binding protein 2
LLGFAIMIVACTPSTPAATLGASEPTLPPPAMTVVSAPNPETLVDHFLEAWSNYDYEGMYAMLSPLSQDSISSQEFADRYQEVRRAAALTGVDHEIVSSLINPQAAQVRYRLTLHSAVVGDLTRETWVDLKRYDGEWLISWTDGAIMPELTRANGLYLNVVTPTRANIYDRNGLALAVQDEIVALWLVPDQIGGKKKEERMLGALSRLLGEPPQSIEASYDRFRDTNFYIPLGEVSVDEFQQEEDALASAGGVQWAYYSGRYYLGSGMAAHAVGYVAQIQQEQLDDYLARGYQQDAFVGQTGVELAYEDELRGVPGGTLYLTDAEGQPTEILASRDSQPPQAVYTTLDRNLQSWAERAIAGFNGAIVVLERDTGAVLAMVSSPGFDPNLWDARNPNSGPGLTDLMNSEGQPQVDRATHGVYPLGSVFKIITFSAALNSGIYTIGTEYTCNGEFRELPGQVLYDWTVERELPPHGTVSLLQGLEVSCNPFFWHIGLDLYNQGLPTALPEMAEAYGLGQSTGIEIGDASGQVPNPEMKLETTGEEWTPGDAVQLAIGQSSLQVTPLQVARFISAIGNGGTLLRPQIIEKVQTAEGEVSHEFKPDPQGQLPLDEADLGSLQEAMFGVTSSPIGTARRVLRYPSTFSIKVAGKTGTAESGLEDPHAWFAGYTLMDREDLPDIAVVVIVENQGEGSEWAAPIFRRVVEAYFFGRPYTLYRWESEIGVTRTPEPTEGPGGENSEATPEGGQ